MEYRSLGRTGIQVSPLCLGCLNFGHATQESESVEIINVAISEGVNFLDTANVYTRGRSEEIIGKALKQNRKRDKIILATKVYGRMANDDPNAHGNSRRHILQQCEASLKRLQTDYIDLYQIHRPSRNVPLDETLRALDDLIKAGKVRYIGTSTFAAWQLVGSLWISKELGLNRFVCEQPPYNLLDRRIENELIPMALAFGMAIIPWSPLAGGFLTGKYKRNQIRPRGSRYDREKNSWCDRLFSSTSFDILEGVEKIAEKKGCTISQFALAWCTQQLGIISPIIGPRTLQQLKDNLGSLNVEITKQDLETIDSLASPGTATVPHCDL